MRKLFTFSSKFWLLYCLAWIPFVLSYTAVCLTDYNYIILNLVFSVSRNVISAAVLGVFIVLICQLKTETLAHYIENAHAVFFAAQKSNFVARAEFAGFLDCQIKTAPTAFRKPFDYVRTTEANA